MNKPLEENYHRRTIRLQDYDYSLEGAYYITICVQNRSCLFGDIANEIVIPNDAGNMVQKMWDELPLYYPGIALDAFILMPNHVHGIIVLTGETGQARGPAPTFISLPDVMQRFKSITTAKYRKGVTENGWAPFEGKLWQRNYYEHIIRSEKALNSIREYIFANPAKWAYDKENPAHN